MIKIYVAGSLDDKHIVESLSNALEATGRYVVTNHWWTDTTRADFEKKSRDAFNALQESEFFVLLNSFNRSSGKFIELGIAFQRKLPVLVVGLSLTSVFRAFAKKHVNFSGVTETVAQFEQFVGENN